MTAVMPALAGGRPPTERELEYLRLALIYGFDGAAAAAGVRKDSIAKRLGDLAIRLGVPTQPGRARSSRLIRTAIAVGWLVIPEVPRAGRHCPIHLVPMAVSSGGPGRLRRYRCNDCRRAETRAAARRAAA